MPSLDDIDPQRLSLLETNPTQENFDQFVEFIRIHYGLASIGYTCSAFRGRHPNEPFLTLTYCGAPAARDQLEGVSDFSPVEAAAMRSADPIDWASFRRFETKVQLLFNAPEPTARTQGLTIPVHGPTPGLSALFSLTSHDSDSRWSARRYELMKDMVHVAYFVHQKAFDIYGEGSPVDFARCTAREIEALQWASEGLEPEDIGFAMRISVETAKACLDSARYKLQALNRTHAVNKAIRAGLIH